MGLNGDEVVLTIPELYPQYSIIEGPVHAPIDGLFGVEGLSRKELDRTSSHVYFDHAFGQNFGISPEVPIESTLFSPRPDLKVEQDSRNGVYFGNLLLRTVYGNEVTPTVACKPLPSVEAIHEYASYKRIGNVATFATLKPVGIFVDNNGHVTLLTVFDDMHTLDKIDWAHPERTPLEKPHDIRSILRGVSKGYANMHGNGYVHYDAQAKHSAVSDRQTHIFDFTSMRRYLDIADSNGDILALQQGMYRDIKDLIESIFRDGYLYDMDTVKKRKFIMSAFVEPYRSVLRHPSTPLQQSAPGLGIQLADEIFDQVLEEIL